MDAGLLDAWSAVDYKFFCPRCARNDNVYDAESALARYVQFIYTRHLLTTNKRKKNVKVAGSLTVRISVVNDRSGIHDFLFNQSINQSFICIRPMVHNKEKEKEMNNKNR